MNRKARLFDIFSRNFSLYLPGEDEWFVCPVCHRAFGREHLDHLDLGHIFPKFLGGSETTLLCRKCNNRLGTQIEGSEAKRVHSNARLSDPTKPPHPVRVRFVDDNISSAEITAFLKIEHEPSEPVPTLRFDVLEGRTHPQRSREFFDLMRKSTEIQSKGWSQNVSITYGYDEKLANLTYLAHGFLKLFHVLGYEWLLSPTGQLVSKQLREPESNCAPPHLLKGSPLPEDALGASLIWISKPPEYAGHLIPIPENPTWGSGAFLWLPGTHSEYPTELDDAIQGNKIEIRAFTFPEGELEKAENHSWWFNVQYGFPNRMTFSRI